MRLNQLQYGSLLSYCPRGGDSEEIQRSRLIMRTIKIDSFVEDPLVVMSEWISKTMERQRSELPFDSFFRTNTVLVPLPRSSLLQPDSLWVPERLASSLVRRGFGARVMPCLTRTKAVRKSATSPPWQRPTPSEHYESMAVQGNLESSQEIVLIDDIVTRGHTMIGAANRPLHAFPSPRILAFAAMRTISDWKDFSHIYDPKTGSIDYRQDLDDCLRTP
jgi:phosphoribosylpyrophosphate synthetase